MPTFVNLTPHPLDMLQADGTVKTIPTSGAICRITEALGSYKPDANGVWTLILPDEQPTGLPDPEDGVFFVVVRPVAVAMAFAGEARDDVVVIKDLVRDPRGQVLGASGFARIV